MSNTGTRMQNSLDGINSRVTEEEEHIHKLKDGMVEITVKEQNKNK